MPNVFHFRPRAFISLFSSAHQNIVCLPPQLSIVLNGWWMNKDKNQKKINNKFSFIKRTNLYNYMAGNNNHFRDSFHFVLEKRLNEFTRATEQWLHYLHKYSNKVNAQRFFWWSTCFAFILYALQPWSMRQRQQQKRRFVSISNIIWTSQMINLYR